MGERFIYKFIFAKSEGVWEREGGLKMFKVLETGISTVI